MTNVQYFILLYYFQHGKQPSFYLFIYLFFSKWQTSSNLFMFNNKNNEEKYKLQELQVYNILVYKVHVVKVY